MNLKDIVVLSESPEDEALLDKAESAFVQVRATTKNIKYDDTAIEILSKVGSIVDELDVQEVKDEIEYLERALFDAKNNLESAVYELEAPFEDLIRTLKNKISDEELDREWEERYGTDESILSAMTRPLGEGPAMVNPAIDGEFIDWLKDKGKDTLFPFTLADMNNPSTLERMKQLYYKETGLYPGDGGATATPDARRRARRDHKGLFGFTEDLGTGMIGEPDGYYDAEERTKAYDEMQDAVNYYSKDSIERQNILDGICPNCGGNGYQDGEEEIYNDETEEYEEGNECDGWGNYGCDQGEMTYYSEEGNWIEIMKHDKRQKQRAELAAKPQPSDDVLYKAAKLLHKQYVIDTGRYNAFEVPQLLRQMYPEIPKHKAREIGSKVLSDYKAENKINSDMALTTEGTKSDNAVNTLVNMFHDMLDEFSSEEELEAEVSRQASDLTRLFGDFDTGKATERAMDDLRDNSDYPGSIDREYDARYEGKSPHKKGTKKYKKHMAAMHAGESVTAGRTKKNMRLKELSPRRDNSANEMKVAELLRKALKDPKGEDAYDLYAELESENPELADLYKDVALNQYEVQLEEGKGLLRGIAAGMLILLGINQANEFTSAKNTPLGQDLKAVVQQNGEDADLANYYYKNLDIYVEENDMRTIVNLKIKFDNDDPRFNPARDDVEKFLRDQARLPEPTNERKYRNQGAADVVVGANDKEYIFNKDKKMFVSTNTAEPGGPERVDISTKLGKDLLRRRRNQMARTEPMREEWTPKQAGKKYWWE